MAASITTQADLLTYGIISDNEIERLTDDRMRKNDWATLHEMAWTRVKAQLALRPQPVAEDDLDDTTELKRATIYMVLHYAYAKAAMPGNRAEAEEKRYWKLAIKELAEVQVTVDGDTVERESYRSFRALRA